MSADSSIWVIIFIFLLLRYLAQRHERMTPMKAHSTSLPSSTKRSLYRDLEKQFREETPADSTENIDPRPAVDDVINCRRDKDGVELSERNDLSTNDVDFLSPDKRKCLLTESRVNVEQRKAKPDDQQARYAGALALMQLAKGKI